MGSRISVQGTAIFVQLLHSNEGNGKVGLIMKWHEGLDFAEQLIGACEEAKRNAERLKVIPEDCKNL